uniref:Uncharacterized protein n=1 Tax=Arundo donax TaxID=35708 RepID=A0A0A8YCQ7_ARUDO
MKYLGELSVRRSSFRKRDRRR